MPLLNGDQIPVDFDARHDSNAIGMQIPVKQLRFPEIWGKFDPDQFTSDKPPLDVQSAFREVFGDWVDKCRLKLALHPYFKRWAMFERCFDPESGEPNAWAVVSIFCENPVDGVLPPDLQVDDHRFDNLRGKIGRWKMPSRLDFELISNSADKHKIGVDGVVRAQRKEWEDQRRAAECKHEAALHDAHGYMYWAVNNIANRTAGSGWKLQSVPTIEHKGDPSRWRRENISVTNGQGYTVISRRDGDTHADRETVRELDAERARRARAQGAKQ